jgi:hypothetical protein
MEITGGVWSMLMPETPTLATLPALSVQLPVAACPSPSFERVVGGDSDAEPESMSEHVKLTVTGELFQPAGFAGGVLVAEIKGAVLSTLTGPKLRVETLPAVSMQVPVTA